MSLITRFFALRKSAVRGEVASSERTQALVLIAIVVLGALLRLLSPAMRSNLWYDETFSLTIAQQSFRSLIHFTLLGADANPPLYTVLLHFWLKIGSSDNHIRMLSMIFGIAAVPAMFLLARRCAGVVPGILAALLLAISPAAITFSAEARSYSLLLLLSILSTYFLLGLIGSDQQNNFDRPYAYNFYGYALTSVLAAYTHWFGALLLIVQPLTLIAYHPIPRLIVRRYLTSVGLILLSSSPLLIIFRSQTGMRQYAGGFLWPGRPDIKSLLNLAAFLTGSRELFVFFSAVLIMGILVGALSTSKDSYRYRRVFLAGALYLIVPVSVVFLISSILPHFTFFVPRYFMPFLPAVLVLVAVSFSRLNKRAAAVLMSLVLVYSMVLYARHFESVQSSYRQTAAALKSIESTSPLIVHLSPMSYYPVLHYDPNAASESKVLWSEAASPAFTIRIGLASGLISRGDLVDLEALKESDEIWLVVDRTDKDSDGERLLQAIRSDWRFLDTTEETFGAVSIEHLKLRETVAQTSSPAGSEIRVDTSKETTRNRGSIISGQDAVPSD